MSPTTPSHLALPTQSEGGGGQRAVLTFRMLMEDADRSTCASAQSKEWASVQLFIFRFFFFFPTILFRPYRNITATFPDHCPYSSPICNVEAAIFYGDFLSFQPDVWHSWQIGCGSEGDGVWKQCPCLDFTRSGHIQRQPDAQIHVICVCVRHLTLNTSEPGSPALRQSKRFYSIQGDDPDVKHTTHKQKM